MLRLSNLSLGIDETLTPEKIASFLRISPQEIREFSLVKQSVDARKKQDIRYKYTLSLSLHSEKKESQLLKHSNRQISRPQIQDYEFPKIQQKPSAPVVVGMGPGGLFCALMLARGGCPPVVLERGKPVEQRLVDVEHFWQGGTLDENSNVQFGEGGAGAFSDGKLTTGTNDPRNQALFQILVEKGAPPDILYSHKPHIGTDVLYTVLQNIRKELISLGCDLRFSQEMTGLEIRGDRVVGLKVRSEKGEYSLKASHVVCALGHSARDTFQTLFQENIPLEPKSFAIGVRIEHLQKDIGMAQYGSDYHKLPPTEYKLACHLPSGRSLFSFCVCPGGVVVNASSAPGQMVTNGMSYRNRSLENINGGLLVGVNPQDFHGYDQFHGDHPLAGMYFQEFWEKMAFTKGQGKATCQRVEDFLHGQATKSCGTIAPSIETGVHYGSVADCLPPEISKAMAEGLPHLGNKVRGFDCPDALLTGIETRSSSPLRILRNAQFQSTLQGFYPCGEGAGYAGGIVSAAVDGIKIAEAMVSPF